MSSAMSIRAGRGSAIRRVLLAPFTADTWLAVTYLLSSLPLGVATFTIVVVGLAVSIGLVPVFLLGLPGLALALWVFRLLGRLERGRLTLLLGTRVANPHVKAPGSWWHRLRRRLAAGATWREIGYLILLLPFGVAAFTVVIALASAALALLTMPAYLWALPSGGADFGPFTVRHPVPVIAVSVGGLVLLLATPYAVRGLALTARAMGATLLGPPATGVLAARVEVLQDSRTRVLDAAEAERRRIERDLHDGAQQRLVSLAMNLGRAQARFDEDPAGARSLLDEAHTDAKHALVELRNLARGIHPAVLNDRGLDAALSALAGRCPVPVAVDVDVSARPSPTVESIAYFVVAEALTNAAKHAGARHASVVVRRLGPLLRVAVRDDGRGGADPAGSGLRGLADRVAGVDGRLWIDSPPGGPTALTVELPCQT